MILFIARSPFFIKYAKNSNHYHGEKKEFSILETEGQMSIKITCFIITTKEKKCCLLLLLIDCFCSHSLSQHNINNAFPFLKKNSLSLTQITQWLKIIICNWMMAFVSLCNSWFGINQNFTFISLYFIFNLFNFTIFRIIFLISFSISSIKHTIMKWHKWEFYFYLLNWITMRSKAEITFHCEMKWKGVRETSKLVVLTLFFINEIYSMVVVPLIILWLIYLAMQCK